MMYQLIILTEVFNVKMVNNRKCNKALLLSIVRCFALIFGLRFGKAVHDFGPSTTSSHPLGSEIGHSVRPYTPGHEVAMQPAKQG